MFNRKQNKILIAIHDRLSSIERELKIARYERWSEIECITKTPEERQKCMDEAIERLASSEEEADGGQG